MNGTHEYDDIINLPHHVSARHPQMSMYDRAAQFSPFAALTGHDAAIKETERLTEERVELDEDSKELLDEQLQMIREHLDERPEVTFTYFEPDERKQGGAYQTISGRVKKIDEYEHRILLEEGAVLRVEHLLSIEGELFRGWMDFEK
ncbi:MAG: hypothetical protein PUA77_06175 [Lachnospiraceae bacterium]|nr:YolD-like family protein [Agathobacter sp.]MDD6291355.1 hypothetical protein [Lachnospiraceae bacterium]